MQVEIPKNGRDIINKFEFENLNLFFSEARRILGKEGINNNPNRDEDIVNFENIHNVKLSYQLREYFKIVNGIENAEWISNLYPLDKIAHISKHDWFSHEDYESEEYTNIFILGDIMINSHQWGILLNKDGVDEKIMIMDTETKIADNISDFLMEFINEDPYILVR